MIPLDTVLRSFKTDIHSIELPNKFTYPFFYEPHPLCILASEEVQQQLSQDKRINPLFDPQSKDCLPHGKMFGVLIVKKK